MLPIKNIYTAESAEAALVYLEQYPEAKILAGGTDLIPRIRTMEPGKEISLIDISRIDDLKEITVTDQGVHIGALVTHSRIANHPLLKSHYAALSMACRQIGSLQIRNTASIGGNLCNASPAADSAPALTVFDAEVELLTQNGLKRMPVSSFLKKRRMNDESADGILTRINLPVREGCSAFEKIGGRNALIISTVSCAAAYDDEGYKAAFGSVAPWTVRQPEVEAFLDQNCRNCAVGELSAGQLRELERILAEHLHPISDIRASAEYRLAVSVGLLRSTLELMIPGIVIR